jgi:hypothetical protein
VAGSEGLITSVRVAARVPKLAEENAALGVHGLHDGLPSTDLLLRPNAGHVWVPDPSVGRASGFRNEETTLSCALGVVQSGSIALRHMVVRSAAPGERSQHHPAVHHRARYRSYRGDPMST